MTAITQSTISPRDKVIFWGIPCALIIISAIVYTKDITEGGFRWGDAPSHAMDGVLIHDWVKAGPKEWIHPIDFAVKQYSFYPTLGMGRPYPPGFATVESLFFLIFGVSIPVARFCTACFGMAAILGVYLVAKRFISIIAAICASLAILAIPDAVYWTRQVMLEMPTLCVLIWLIYAVQGYVEKPNWKRWAWVVALMFTAPLFKQTSVFIIPVLGLVFMYLAYHRRIPLNQFITAAVIILTPIMILIGYTFWNDNTSTHMYNLVSLGKPFTEWFTYDTLIFYPRWMPYKIGWVLIILSGAGLIISIKNWSWWSGLLVTWFVIFSIMTLCIQHKEPRYLFFLYFPMAMWIGIFAEQCLCWFSSKRSIISCIMLVGMIILVVQAYGTQVPINPHYGDMVARHIDKIRGKIVFFEGRRDGDFVFAVREKLGNRKALIVRGSKILYSCAADSYWQHVSYVNDAIAVHEKLKSFGFHSLFVEKSNIAHTPEVDLLHDYLREGTTYILVDTVEHYTAIQDKNWIHRTVNVYVPEILSNRTVHYYDIAIPIGNQKIHVDIDELVSELAELKSSTSQPKPILSRGL